MSDLKREFKAFMDDIEKNVTNSKDLEFVKGRVTGLFGVILDEMERISSYKDEKIELMIQNQQDIESKMNKMEHVISKIEQDIYLEEGFDFEIICPYCNSEFIVDINEVEKEVTCPECNNLIELDWNGDLDDGCSDGCCGSCHGCEHDEDEAEDM